MEKLTSILAVIDPVDEPLQVMGKAMALARHFGAKVELFLCDAEHAYALSHAYDSTGTERARQSCLADGRRYLESLRQSVVAVDVKISMDVACESPLYEGILHKVLQSRPNLVIKAASTDHPLRRFSWDANDWQLARTCPVPLTAIVVQTKRRNTNADQQPCGSWPGNSRCRRIACMCSRASRRKP